MALGIYHNARSSEEWHAALAETARVVKPGGRVLVSVFTPETDLRPRARPRFPACPTSTSGQVAAGCTWSIPTPWTSDMAAVGLQPEEPTATAEGKVEVGRRVSANGLYRRARVAE